MYIIFTMNYLDKPTGDSFSNIKTLCYLLKLDKISNIPEKVSGGYLHRMWHVRTDAGEYAVKELNPSIISNEEVVQTYEKTEQVARLFAQNGIPVSESIVYNDCSLINVSNMTFIVYPWFHGAPLVSISITQARKIAAILASIHKQKLIFHGFKEPIWPYHTNDEFRELASRSALERLPFADDLQEMLDDIIRWNDKFKKSIQCLNAALVVSHGDLDQKNVLWDIEGNPILIDWESARLLNPSMEIINAALDWGGITSCNLNFDIFESMITEYIAAGAQLSDTTSQAFYGIFGNWLNWLAFNIKRSLSENSADLAIDQVIQVLKTLKYLSNIQESCTQIIQKIN